MVFIKANEALENSCAAVFRDAGAVIFDFNDSLAVGPRCGAYNDRAVLTQAVADGVLLPAAATERCSCVYQLMATQMIGWNMVPDTICAVTV